jgi:caa(3)-type oxidase subunit IV
MADTPEALKKHVKLYALIGAILFACTGLTVWLSYVDFGSHSLNIGIGLLVATIKALLVALIFMHLNHEKSLIYKILSYTFFFVLGLFVLTMLAFYDPLVFTGFNNN